MIETTNGMLTFIDDISVITAHAFKSDLNIDGDVPFTWTVLDLDNAVSEVISGNELTLTELQRGRPVRVFATANGIRSANLTIGARQYAASLSLTSAAGPVIGVGETHSFTAQAFDATAHLLTNQPTLASWAFTSGADATATISGNVATGAGDGQRSVVGTRSTP